MSWDPGQYLKYAAPRLRPAIDLLQRIGGVGQHALHQLLPLLGIAAHALAIDATLVTNNVKHFSRVHGLRVENWF